MCSMHIFIFCCGCFWRAEKVSDGRKIRSGIQVTAAVLGGTVVVDGVARSRHNGEVRPIGSANSESGRKQKKTVKRRRKPKSPAFLCQIVGQHNNNRCSRHRKCTQRKQRSIVACFELRVNKDYTIWSSTPPTTTHPPTVGVRLRRPPLSLSSSSSFHLPTAKI